MGREDKIRRRAYEIWEREGFPSGREEDHWHQAAREIDVEDSAGGSPSALEVRPKRKSTAGSRKATGKAAADSPPKPKEAAARGPKGTKESIAKAGASTRRRTSKQTGG